MATNETTTGTPAGWRFKVGLALFADNLVRALGLDLSRHRPKLVSSIGGAAV